jgi:lipoate-protein ligase A
VVYIESNNVSPYFNLALEQYVFDHLPVENEYFMLWQNDNSIIIGKHQNTVEEINARYVKEKSISVVRRLSGGGAVYHDLGNINYTFILNVGEKSILNLSLFCEPLVQALNDIGVHAEICGRNDVTIRGKKISGAAQYIKNGRLMHHGTVLFDSDLSVLGKALKVSQDKIESKGLKSVNSRVTNVKEHLKTSMDVEEFKNLLKHSMVSDKNIHPFHLGGKDMKHIQKLEKTRYTTWEWNYGISPDYRIRKERRLPGIGTIVIYLEIENGKIKKYDSRGDYFGSADSNDISRVLEGVALNKTELDHALSGLNIDCYYNNATKEDLIDLLLFS